jgi:hypothetical protein
MQPPDLGSGESMTLPRIRLITKTIVALALSISAMTAFVLVKMTSTHFVAKTSKGVVLGQSYVSKGLVGGGEHKLKLEPKQTLLVKTTRTGTKTFACPEGHTVASSMIADSKTMLSESAGGLTVQSTS